MGKRGKVLYVKIHKALAETYIPNPNHYKIIRHLDNDKHNNSLTNLQWGTPSENRQDYKNYLLDNNITTKTQKLTKTDIIQIFTLREQGLSYQKIANIFEVSKTTIIDILKKRIYNN